MIQAFLMNTSQEALADRIGSGCMIGGFEYLDATCLRHPVETGFKFAVIITNEVFRCVSIRGGFSELLRDPGIGRGACHADMDHFP